LEDVKEFPYKVVCLCDILIGLWLRIAVTQAMTALDEEDSEAGNTIPVS